MTMVSRLALAMAEPDAVPRADPSSWPATLQLPTQRDSARVPKGKDFHMTMKRNLLR